MKTCHYCGCADKETRPYGPGGSDVCFPCATETPEREQAAERAFGALIEGTAVLSPIVAIGTDEGPQPFDPRTVR